MPHCVQCFFLLPSICFHPSWTQKFCCLQTDIRNCFEGSDALLSLVIRQFFAEAELLTISINIIICEDLQWSLVSERPHDVIDPIALMFPIMHQILKSKVSLSSLFLFFRGVIYFLSGCSFGFLKCINCDI